MPFSNNGYALTMLITMVKTVHGTLSIEFVTLYELIHNV